MSEQLALIETLAVPTVGGRAGLALDHIQAAGEGGLHPEEVGALLHARDGIHLADQRCEHCGKDGAKVLRDLHRRRLITRRHGNAAVAVTRAPVGPEKTSAMGEDIGF